MTTTTVRRTRQTITSVRKGGEWSR